jgi:hypothetical protein
MPRYKVDEKVYNLPEDKVSPFKQVYPEAVLLDEDLGNSKGSQNTDATVESNSTASTSEGASLDSQSTAIDKLEESFQKARLSDSEIKEANDRGISAVNQYYSDYSTFQSYQEEKANRKDVNDESFILEGGGFNYELMLEQNNASTFSTDQTSKAEVVPSFDSNIHNKIKQINQNKAFYKYVNDKNINLSNLNEEELANKKSQILNSDEFTNYLDVEEQATRDYGEKIADLDRQLRVATTEQERQTILNKIANIEKDNPAHEEVVLLQQRENRANDIEDKVIEQVDEMGFRFWSRGDEQEDLIEAAAIKEGNLKNKSEGLLSKIEVLSKQSETTYNEMLTLNNWFNTTGKEYQKEMKQIASKQYTSQEDLDTAKERIKTLQQEYNGKVNTYETLKQTGIDQSALNTKLQSQFQDLNIEVEEFAAYSSGIKRNPGQLTAFFANIGNSTIDLAQGIVNTVDMVSQIPDEFLKEIDDPGVRSFLQTTYNIVNPVFADGTDGVSIWDDAKEGVDEWQYKNVTSKIRKPIQFDEIESVSDSVEYGANLLATQIPNLALMYATGGSSLYFLGASSAGSKYDSMQKEKEMFYNTGGLYGHDHSFGAMFLNSSFTGTTESLSERVTLGAINRTAKSLFRNLDDITIKKGYRKYLRDNVFTYKNTKATALEFNEEGFSEFLATASGNFADIVSGKNVNIYDGGLESYVSGALISGSIQSPRLYKALIAPFKTSQTNQRLQVINNRVDQINQEILDLTKSKDPNAAEQLQKLKDERIQLVDEYHKASEKDIKRVNLLDQEQKTELVEIDKSKQDIARRIKEVQSSELSQAEKDAELKKLNKEYLDGQKRKDQILNSISDDAIPASYAQEVEAMKAYEKQIKDRGVVDIDFVERSKREFEDMIAQDQTGNQLESKAELEDFVMQAGGTAVAMQEIIDDPNSTEAEKQEAREALEFQSDQTMAGVGMLDFIAGNARNYGAMAPRFDDKGNLVGLQMNINKSTALTDGQFNVPSHEFVHAAFYNTLKADPVMQEKMGGIVDQIIENGDVEFLPGQKEAFDKKINMYEGNVKGEEKLAFLTEFVRGNKAKIKESGLQKIKGMFRRFAQNYLGRDIKLDTNQDIVNFIKDYDVSIQNNKPSPAIIRMMEKGANGKLFKDARTPQERKDQMMYSKALEANIDSNPDLKETFDQYTQNEDGTPKFESQEAWEASPEYWEAYFQIVEGRALDGLIQAHMTSKGLPPAAIRDFTRKVKEKIGERFLPTVDKKTGEVKPDSGYRVSNDSLFGWLTGVAGGQGKSIVYRAKGDVMAEYKADITSTAPSLDAPIGDAGTIADLIPSDSSVMDAIENENLSIGRRNTIKEIAQNELIAKDELKLSQDAKDAIRDVVAEANIPLDGLTYKGFKKLMVESMKVDKNGKLKPPTKESDVVPVGALYNVLEITASEFGIDPARILANQDLDANQRRLAQEKILNLSINPDGSFNDILFQLLPEGETRSGEATGVANTKLGDFYTTGDRVKVSEGASKALGQKKEQNKKTRITKKEFLDKFGINEDGTFRTGTSADGAIRALVTQMAQLNANQEVRINALENGTASEAVAAKLGDGKGVLVFSKASSEVLDNFNEVVETVAASDKSSETVDNIFDTLFGKKQSAEVKDLKKKIKKVNNEFAELDSGLKDLGGWTSITDGDVVDFIRTKLSEQLTTNTQIKKALQELMPKNKDGKTIDPGSRANEIEGAQKQRDFLTNMTARLAEQKGSEAAATIAISQLMPMYAGASKAGDGRNIDKEPGGQLIKDPNWEGENGNKWKRNKDGSFKLDKKGNKIEKTNRQQSTTGKNDFLALVNKGLEPGFEVTSPKKGTYILKGPDGTSKRLDVSMPAESTKGFNTETKKKSLADIFKTRKQKSLEAREEVQRIAEAAWERVQDKNDSFDAADFGLLVMSLGSSMDAPLRRGAYVTNIPSNFEALVKKYGEDALGQIFQYEHAKPKGEVAIEIIDSFVAGNGFPSDAFDGYEVDIIPKIVDRAIDATGYKYTSRTDGNRRAYNLETALWVAQNATDAQIADLEAMVSIDPDNPNTFGDNWLKIVKALRSGGVTQKDISLAGFATRNLAFSKAPNPRGMSAFDFDETLIIDGDNFIIATDPATGKEIKISSGDWPLKGPELMDQGYDFNFDDFINVRGGVEGPLFQKFKNRIAKYGPENNYILTARPAEAAIAIHGWLKSKGINIPLENITGLGNSTGAAKAQWMLRKFEEGYNDMYFVDDALPNVEAVANIIDQLDIKGKSVQAKLNFSKENPSPIDDMLERNKDVPADETFNRVKARNKGKQNRKRQLFIPPSADDFEGLMYYNYGKGEQGNSDAKFFKQKFYDPFNRADRQLDMYKQKLREDVKKISKALPEISKNLNKEFENSGYTNEQAMRIYLYDKNGQSVPGISEADQKRVARNVAKNQNMVLFAGSIEAAIGVDGYLKPQVGWNASSFNGDMADAAKIKRKEYLEEWQVNVDEYFTEDMLNKLEAVHGSAYRAALEDTLARMKSGTNRPTIRNKHVNAFLDWLNGSVGAIMFVNVRSSVLQTLSTVNFINFEDNNVFAAAKAFANQKQYWKDFSMLFSSPMLKQRRGGLQSDLNASELQRLAEKGGARAVIGRLLELGFAPTQIADSFAISAGGSTFYRNRVNKYIKEGVSQKQAEDQAFIDFQEIAEATQQSSRPDKISQEQASVLGRLILAFQNTPMQYNRLIKKAALDLINNRGDWKSNISRIIYYGAAQNIIFSSLQSALFAVAFDDDEDEEFLDKKLDRIANGTLDSLLRGSGIYGAVLSTVKNTVLKYVSEREKGMQADNGRVLVEALNVSPPLGSKARKLYSAMTSDKWNQGVYDKIPLSNIDNPIWDITGNLVEASFNIPLARIQRKLSNLKAASDNDNANWQRLALLAGWDKWGLGIERPEEVEEARQEVKEEKREQKKQDRKTKEVEAKKEKEEKYLEDQKKEKEENKKPRCAAATKDGSRCKGEPVDGTYCTIHAKVEKRSDGKKTQCKKIKSDGKRCKMQTNSKSGFCYYHD